MGVENGKNREQFLGRTQNSSAVRFSDAHSEEGASRTGQSFRNLHAGIHGKNRKGHYHNQCIVGGILSQLIEDVAEQLAETKASVAKLEKTLESLEQAKALLQESEPPDCDN